MTDFPIQLPGLPATVPRKIAERAYLVYSFLYGTEQSLDRLGERGGFGMGEILDLLAGEMYGHARARGFRWPEERTETK
jgi:hypothetical protein